MSPTSIEYNDWIYAASRSGPHISVLRLSVTQLMPHMGQGVEMPQWNKSEWEGV